MEIPGDLAQGFPFYVNISKVVASSELYRHNLDLFFDPMHTRRFCLIP